MNKREHIEISKAIVVATICPDMAARNLATVHRSTRTQSTREHVELLINQLDLSKYLTTINNCLVPL